MYKLSKEMKELDSLKQGNANYERENNDLRIEMEKCRKEADRRIQELQNKLTEREKEREKAQAPILQIKHPPSKPNNKRTTTKSFANWTPRLSTSEIYRQRSSFNVVSSKSKISTKTAPPRKTFQK